MRRILFILATHGDEGYSIPVMEEVAKNYPKEEYGYTWIIGNPEALEQGVRFTQKDLNRSAPGNPDSQYYEERRAAELMSLSQQYDLVIDIHGSIGECGVTTIIPLPTKENLFLAQEVGVERNVIWYSLSSQSSGPIAQHTTCPSIEIECGPKDSSKTAAALYTVIERILKNNQAEDFFTGSLEKTSEFFLVYGREEGEHDPALVDFEQATTADGEEFFPYMANQYDGVTCYKMRLVDSTEAQTILRRKQ
jgi:hypothetical protein